MRRRAASERGRMSAWNGFGQHESPDVYSPEGVISFPSGPMGLRMSIVAHSDAIAIHTLFIPRKRPGQMLQRARGHHVMCHRNNVDEGGTYRRPKPKEAWGNCSGPP